MTIKFFKNDLFEVNAKLDNGEIVFDVEKVALSLGVSKIANGKRYVRWERINKYLTDFNCPQVDKGDYIPEKAVYLLAMKANNEIAIKFQMWLADEVVPSIRKHGAYMTDDTLEKALTSPDFLIQLATNLKKEQEARKLAESKNKLLNKENDALSQDILEWADESIINALVRKYGASIGKFGDSWIEFKKSLLYKYSINLNSRITNYLNNTNKKTKPKTLSMLKGKEELTKGLKTAISMCREKEIDVSDILGKHLSNKEIDKMIS